LIKHSASHDTKIASDSGDGTVKVWAIATGKLLRMLRGHTDPVWSVAWSPDGKAPLIGDIIGNIIIWYVV